jgi:hypothetical protein
VRLTLSTNGSPQACGETLGIGPPPLGCFYTAPQLATLPGGVYRVERTPARPTALHLPLLRHNAFPGVPSGVTPTSGGTVVPREWGEMAADRVVA